MIQLKKTSYLFPILLLVFSKTVILHAQDATTNVSLVKTESLEHAIFSKKAGLWITIAPQLSFSREERIIKFSPELKAKEWEVVVKNVEHPLIYDAKNPSYVYLYGNSNGFNKKTINQISPTGQLKKKELTSDDMTNDLQYTFCRSNHLIEVWTKKKSDDDLVILRTENETGKRSKSLVKIPVIEKDFKPSLWIYSGATDSLLLLTRHNKKNKKVVEAQVVLINLFSGKVVRDFYFVPAFKTVKEVAPSYFDISPQGVYASSNITSNLIRQGNTIGVDDSEANVKGQFRLSNDGKSIYHYSFANFSGKMAELRNIYKYEGFQVSKLDINGKLIWQQETKLSNEELSDLGKFVGMPSGSLSCTEYDDKSVGFEYYFVISSIGGSGRRAATGIRYSVDGKQLELCNKGYKMKASFSKNAKSSVSEIDDLYPCFSSNTDRMTKYIEGSKGEARYSIFTDNGMHIMTVLPEKERTINIFYFKN